MSEYTSLQSLMDEMVHQAIVWTMDRAGFNETADGGFMYRVGISSHSTGVPQRFPGPGEGPTPDLPAGYYGSWNPGEMYAQWRTNIETAFQGWTDLPDPAAFDHHIATVTRGANMLSLGDKGAGGYEGAGVQLANEINTVMIELGQFNGVTADKFSDRYVNRFGPVANGQCHIGAALVLSMTAEQKLWTEARASITRIADAGVAAMKATMHGNDGETSKVLSVLGVLLSAAGLVLSGGTAAPVIGGASTVLGILTSTRQLVHPDQPTVELGGDEPEDVLNNLVKAIGTLNQNIKDEETRIHDMVSRVYSDVLTNDGNFNLARPQYLFDETDPTKIVTKKNELALEPRTLRTVGNVHLPEMAAILRSAAKDIDVDPSKEIWHRPPSIGNAPYGPWAITAILDDHLGEILLETAHELVDAGEILVIAAGAFEKTDGQVSQELKAHQKEIWAPPPPPVSPPPRPGGHVYAE